MTNEEAVLEALSFGDRMKDYEDIPRTRLTPKIPVLIRLDGKAFHTFTRGMDRPYDLRLHRCMQAAAKALCRHIQGCQVAYVQSDEITLLLTDYQRVKTQGWFNNEVQKMASVSAGLCSTAFLKAYLQEFTFESGNDFNAVDLDAIPTPCFDSRVWNLPKAEVVNAFIWRQADATRNAIQLVGQSKFSPSRLHGVSCNEIQEMLFTEHQINFNDLPVPQKRGVCVVKETYLVDRCSWRELPPEIIPGVPWAEGTTVERTRWIVDEDIPVFTKDRSYIQKFVDVEEAE